MSLSRKQSSHWNVLHVSPRCPNTHTSTFVSFEGAFPLKGSGGAQFSGVVFRPVPFAPSIHTSAISLRPSRLGQSLSPTIHHCLWYFELKGRDMPTFTELVLWKKILNLFSKVLNNSFFVSFYSVNAIKFSSVFNNSWQNIFEQLHISCSDFGKQKSILHTYNRTATFLNDCSRHFGCQSYNAEAQVDDVTCRVPILQFLHACNLHTQTVMCTSTEHTLHRGP